MGYFPCIELLVYFHLILSICFDVCFLFQGLVAGGRLPWLFSTSDLCNVAAMLNDPRINPTGMKEAWVGGKRKDFDSDTAFYWHHVKGMKTMLV